MKKYIIPIQIPYCKNKKEWTVTKEESEYTNEKIKETIDWHLKEIEKEKESLEEKQHVEILFVNGFSELEANKQIAFIDVAQEYIANCKVDEIGVSAEPQDVNKEFLKMLKKHKIKHIKLDIYTCNEYLLRKINAKYNFKDIKKICRMIRFNRFNLEIKMTIGLPESTKIDDINTAKSIVGLKPKYVSVDSILILKGSELEKKVNDKSCKALTLVQATEISKEVVKTLTEKNIKIEEIGYEQKFTEAEQVEIAKELVDGPFHPAFRQIVEGSLWYDVIVSKIKMLNVKVEDVEVKVNPIDINNVIGYKQENINKLKEVYDVNLIVTEDSNIKQGKSKIEVTKIFKDFKEE